MYGIFSERKVGGGVVGGGLGGKSSNFGVYGKIEQPMIGSLSTTVNKGVTGRVSFVFRYEN